MTMSSWTTAILRCLSLAGHARAVEVLARPSGGLECIARAPRKFAGRLEEDERYRISAPPENAARLMEEFSRLDVRPLLADIQVP